MEPSSKIHARARPITVDDLMGLSTINDVEIAPAGDRVAYTVSTPSVPTNTHETALFVLPVGGGTPVRLAAEARIFVPALPAPRLRWAPDGTRISFLATVESRPQVFVVSPEGGPAHAVTTAPEGVTSYEWSPDGTRLAFLTRDRAPAPPVANQAGSLPPAVRLWVQDVGSPPSARALTPDDRFVDSFAWKPTGEEIAFASSPTSGFMAPYATRIDAVTMDGRTTRSIVDRAGMNVQPRSSPDGGHVSFISTGGRAELLAPRGLAVVPAAGGDPSRIRSVPDERRLDRRDRLGPGQPVAPRHDERGHLCGRRADVRDACRSRDAPERPRRANLARGIGGLQPEPQPRRPHARLPIRRSADDGRAGRAGRVQRDLDGH